MRKAFTLAEVLITLGIIGIVAAMTLPTLIQKQQNKAILTSLNKSYSELQNIVNLISNDMGEDISKVAETHDNKALKELFMKYYQNAKDCYRGECYTKETYYYKTYTGNDIYFYNVYFGQEQFITKEGRLISFGGTDEWGRMITVDVNGPFKNPNAWGRDTFTFLIMNKQIVPCGGNIPCSNRYNYNCNSSETGLYSGLGCTYYALTKPHFLDHKYYYDRYIYGEL